MLAITRDAFILRDVRLRMPLLNLKKQGLIEDFFITNPTLFDVPQDALFDVIWLQRVDDAGLIAHLGERLGHHYLYDLDDLLLGRAAYRGLDLVNQEGVLEAVRRARLLTVTSNRLVSLLEKYTQAPLAQKSLVCPNACEFPQAIRKPAKPGGMILAFSESFPLTNSYDPVMGAVAEFSERRGLPVYYFGKETEKVRARFRRLTSLGLVPYWHYHALLAALPPMIGLAPLETKADPETLDFISGKSDIKMLEFGGHGHPGVYSNAPPYVDTDLQAGVVVDNTFAAWREGLDAVYG
ncbi:hypothetical protein A2V61_04190, partial [Candidatus Woesebacteria bacterium RBG_19FT_COMBO_47_8]